MKKVFIFCMFLSIGAYGRWGWTLDFYSFKGGANWSEVDKFVPTVGAEYTSGLKTCTNRRMFKAIGVNTELHPGVFDIQGQVKINPFKGFGVLPLKMKTTLFSYFLVGIHYRKQEAVKAQVLFKPGLGFVVKDRSFGRASLLPEVNVGYVFNDNITDKKPYLFVEMRLGISYKKRKSSDEKEKDEL